MITMDRPSPSMIILSELVRQDLLELKNFTKTVQFLQKSSYTIVVKVKDWDRWNSDDHVEDLIGRVELSAAWSTGQPITLWGRTQ